MVMCIFVSKTIFPSDRGSRAYFVSLETGALGGNFYFLETGALGNQYVTVGWGGNKPASFLCVDIPLPCYGGQRHPILYVFLCTYVLLCACLPVHVHLVLGASISSHLTCFLYICFCLLI